ncbi:dipeptidase [Tropicimonas isoalkanivorans]|uniref:Dipeptidase AC. Metallo peptidase. MEROPS family M19 n=1 Tax=Tropicimonas isoalkanivorans TaxID=441112 RepID=A0A1I1IGF7_9RHOB|nr:dipeptidase [Tropicimonas isoalkanivorans]SFC35031.1 dipeptidase AC. Metallo peptidase. MEROPS family M19 [Tropicimonas isoalkanivorans]
MTDTIPVFDGHNDFLLRLYRAPQNRGRLWLEGGPGGHIDLPRMQAGGMAGGLFAIFLPSPAYPGGPDTLTRMPEPPFTIPLPPPLEAGDVAGAVMAMLGHWAWMERAAGGAFAICRTVEELRAAMDRETVAGVLHLEGAEAIGPDLDTLHVLHAAGLRSLGPVWSRPNAFGHGVPFAFPAGPDVGPGLTEAGKDLVRECNALKILVDLSHLNAAGVEDVAAISDAPLVATHSNAHALCPSPRNLTDRQLDMIAERGGLVGLNFGVFFLREDGRDDPQCGWEPVLRHLDYLIEKLGEDHVGFGSDFDGCVVPDVLGDAAGLQGLIGELRSHGFDEPLLRKLACENWLGVLKRTWGA